MKKTKDERRLNAIKQIITFIDVECRSCGNYFSFTKMWKVNRWGINKTVHPWCYCKDCMKSKEEVLYEIDTDDCAFGIAYVDPQTIEKKDYTRYNKRWELAENALAMDIKKRNLKK